MSFQRSYYFAVNVTIRILKHLLTFCAVCSTTIAQSTPNLKQSLPDGSQVSQKDKHTFKNGLIWLIFYLSISISNHSNFCVFNDSNTARLKK